MLDELRIYSKEGTWSDGMGAPWIYYECTVKSFCLDSSRRGVTAKRGVEVCGGVGVCFFFAAGPG